MHALTTQAIAAALANDWENAVTLNQKILQETPTDCDALNRLGYAFHELGRLDEAQEIFERVLTLDPSNTIATKNLFKLNQLNGSAHIDHLQPIEDKVNPSFFIEEPGKTKTSNLIRIAAKDIIASLRVGLRVHLLPKSHHTIAVMKGEESCIGYLPDDLAFLLSQFITGGNMYEVFIRSVSPTNVTVFIRETKKSSSFQDIPSFMDTKKLQGKVIGLPHREIHIPSSNISEDTEVELETEAFENR